MTPGHRPSSTIPIKVIAPDDYAASNFFIVFHFAFI